MADRIARALETGDTTGLMPACLQLPIYKEACRILDLPQPHRRQEIEKHPLADMLAAEVIRLHKFRQTVMQS